MKKVNRLSLSGWTDRGLCFLKRELRPVPVVMSLLGSAILSLGLCHIHSWSDVTEGGILGLTLLLDHHFGISPAFSGMILNVLCYLLGWRYLGKKFLLYSGISTLSFSLTYKFWELFDPFFPALVDNPLMAAIAGAAFVGVGAGLCVRVGGAPCGDDALAMALSERTRIPIQWIYLLSDLSVLGLALTYIPARRMLYSLLTVLLSGQLVGVIQRFPRPGESRKVPAAE